MNTEHLVSLVEAEFSERYSHFKEFQMDTQFRPLWTMCIDTVKNHDNMTIIVFCNDIYKIPPVKVFVDLNRDQLDDLLNTYPDELLTSGKRLKTYVKQCLGAFWGMVFRFGLGYADRRSTSVVQKDYYGIATASRFVHNAEDE